MQSRLDILSNQYDEAMIELKKANTNIERLENEISAAEQKITENQSFLDAQAINTYKHGDIPYLSVIVNAEDFGTFVSNLDYCNRAMEQTYSIIEETKDLKVQLEDDKVEYEQAKTIAETKSAEAQEAMDTANATITDLQAKYNSLDAEISQLMHEREMARQQEIEQKQVTAAATESAQAATAKAIVDTNKAVKDNLTKKSNANTVVERAYNKIGCPYSWGGTTSAGFDCSGFVSYCLTGQEGVRLGTTGTFISWPRSSNPQPGDVCVVHNSNHQHTGIYVGGGMMIHASTYGVGVIEGPVSSDMIIVKYPG